MTKILVMWHFLQVDHQVTFPLQYHLVHFPHPQYYYRYREGIRESPTQELPDLHPTAAKKIILPSIILCDEELLTRAHG